MASEPVRHRFSSRADGDLVPSAPVADLARRRAAIAPGPWTWLRQVHGAGVVVVTEPGQHAGAQADASVTATPNAVLSVTTADCAPVVLVADQAVGVAHAGWRGLVAGVLEAAVDAVRELAPHSAVKAVLGPCIRSECYEFGANDLDEIAARYGDAVRATTAWATPSLDLSAAVRVALRGAGVDHIEDDGTCTACDDRYFSHRARGDSGRQAGVAWLEPEPPAGS